MVALESASKYLNNLLLARGLLQDGKPIDFAHPAQGDEDATMSKIINLVHDLVLRRDRESERHEAMASSIRTFKVTEAQYALDLQNLQDKNCQMKNEVMTAQAQDRLTRATLKSLEKQIKELKEQNLKMKSMLDQVRAKCTSDVRKRDVEIEKLKGHLVGMQRGKKDSSGMKINTLDLHAAHSRKECRAKQDVNSANWSLNNETNDFLAAIVNETSTENVSLRQIVNETLATLKDMSGFEGEEEAVAPEEDGIGIPGQYRKSRQMDIDTLIPVSSLADQMDEILQHCRTILRDPSFVPIEEVQARDEEIVKLQTGWVKMADRWKEAVTMMGQWKQRMILEGKDADMGEFSDLSFGRSIAIRPDGRPVLDATDGLSMIFEENRTTDDSSAIEVVDHVDGANQDSESDLELEPPRLRQRLASSPAKRGLKLPRPPRPLGEADGNARTVAAACVPARVDCFDESYITENQLFPIDSSSKLSELTVAQKLAAIENEAVESKSGRVDPGQKRKASAARGTGLRSGRRRSTLTPAELELLMGV